MFLIALRRILRPLHCCRVAFHLLRLLAPAKTVAMSTREAESCMAEHHPDRGRSSLRDNVVAEAATCDLRIIVPVYNSAPYVAECLDSIARQRTDYKFRVTVVDDGSTDGSADIVDRYADYPQFDILHQENRGVSAARNRALQLLDSTFVLFVDSDDTLPPDAVQHLLDEAFHSNSDIVEGRFSFFQGKSNPQTQNSNPKTQNPKLKTQTQNPKPQTQNSKLKTQNPKPNPQNSKPKTQNPTESITGYAAGKIIRSKFFRRFAFPEGYRYEDTIITSMLLPMARRVAVVPETTYNYRQHGGSFTAAERANYATLDAYWVVRTLLRDMEELDFKFTPQLYSQLLLGMKNSADRIATLDPRTAHAYFAGMCNLAEQYFACFDSEEFDSTVLPPSQSFAAYRALHRAVRTRNYRLYLLAGILL